MTLMQQAIPGGRTPCHFRAKYPDDILLDQINGRFELYIVTTGIVFINIHCVTCGQMVIKFHVQFHLLLLKPVSNYAPHFLVFGLKGLGDNTSVLL